jgi:hypothetical protein
LITITQSYIKILHFPLSYNSHQNHGIVQPAPRDPLQMTVKDYAFKINVLVGDLERGVPAPVDDDSGNDGGLDVSGSGSDSDSNGGAPPAVTTSA